MRQSNFEVLRLVCMWAIVFYHILIHWAIDQSCHHPLYEASSIFFHFGVTVFVLLSGWFGIKLHAKRIVGIFLPFAFYTLIIELIITQRIPLMGGTVSMLLMLDNNQMWFIRPYIMLCLLSPFINTTLDKFDNKQTLLLLILGAIIIFIYGFLFKCQFASGKSVLCFCYLYVLGRILRQYKDKTFTNKRWLYIILFVCAIIIYGGKLSDLSLLKKIAGAFYAYNSPLLMLLASLIVMIFSNFGLQSYLINKIASHSFAIYLIGNNPYILELTKSITNNIMLYDNIGYTTKLLILVILALFICTCCLSIDMLAKPIISRMVGFISNKINICLNV